MSGLLASPAFAQSTWTLAGNGNWNTASNWTPAGVPNGATTDVIINDGVSTVTLNVIAAVRDLDMAPGNALFFTNGQTLFVHGTVTNQGTIRVDHTSTSGSTEFRAAADATLVGSGTLIMSRFSSGGNARVTSDPGFTLTQQAGHSILGAGRLDAALVNLGLVRADASAAVTGATLQLAVSNKVNQGLIQAAANSVLEINGITVTNSGGAIQALADSQVLFVTGSTVMGGVIESMGTGVVRTSGSGIPTTFQDLTINGLVESDTRGDIALLGSIHNTGRIRMNPGNATSDTLLRINGSGATLTGGGTITLIGTGGASEASVTGSGGTLTILSQTIEGSGDLGRGQIAIVNQAGGLIQANTPGRPLIVSANAGGVTNRGNMRASNGGNLVFSATLINNESVIQAFADSQIQFTNGSTVAGGVIESIGSGFIRTSGSGIPTTFQDLTINGRLESDSRGDIALIGTINNTGNIRLNPGNATSDTLLRINGSGATLTGGGTITLIGNAASVTGSGGTLTIVSQTFEGSGDLGRDLIAIVNQVGGLIDANTAGGPITINANAGNFTNQSVARASNGGNLVISDTLVINAGGTIQALADSQITLSGGSTLLGGVIESIGTGVIRTSGSSPFTTLQDLTINGRIETNSRGDIAFVGLINNTGDIRVNPGNATSDTLLRINGAGASLTGGGTVTLTGSGSSITGSGGTLTIVSQVVEGGGDFGRGNIAIVNQAGGLIHASTGTLTVDVNAGGLVNQGTLRASNGRSLVINETFTNDGVIDARSASRVDVNGSLTNAAGGQVQGGGELEAVLFTNHGKISPGSAVGILTLDLGGGGLAVLGSTSVLEIELAGVASFDRLTILGNAGLNGKLAIDLLDGFLPSPSDVFTVLTANNNDLLSFGQFVGVADGGTLFTVDGEGTFTVDYFLDAGLNSSVRLLQFTPTTVSNWTGTSGNWSDPAQWSAAVPTNGTPADSAYNVTIPDGTVTLDVSPTVQKLTLTDAEITGSGSLTVVNTTVIDGDATLGGAGTLTTTNLELSGSSLTLSGTREVIATGSTDWVAADTTPQAVTLSPTNTFTNAGTLTLDPANDSDWSGGLFFNQGVLNKRGASSVSLMSDLRNSGTVNVQAGQLTLSFGTHTGAFRTAPAGILRFTGVNTFNPGSSIDGNVTFGGNALFTGSSLRGNLTFQGAAAFNAGTVIDADALRIEGEATLDTGITASTNSLTIAGSTGAWTGKLDLKDNALVINPSAANKGAAILTLQDQINSGRNGPLGPWTGNGITSSTIVSTPNTTLALADNADLQYGSFRGQPLTPQSLIIVQAHLGDATLDGIVDAFDLNKLAANWQQSGKLWSGGEFTGDGKVDAFDLNVLAGQWQFGTAPGASLAAALAEFAIFGGAGAVVPEPGTLGVLGLGGLAVLRRRSKKRGR